MKKIILMMFAAIAFNSSAQTRVLCDKVLASYYHDMFVGRTCANGDIFTQEGFTAAHRTLKFGTILKITNLKNDSSVIVRVNDRMPPRGKCEIDLTTAAAKKLNFMRAGITQVRIEIIDDGIATARKR